MPDADARGCGEAEQLFEPVWEAERHPDRAAIATIAAVDSARQILVNERCEVARALALILSTVAAADLTNLLASMQWPGLVGMPKNGLPMDGQRDGQLCDHDTLLNAHGSGHKSMYGVMRRYAAREPGVLAAAVSSSASGGADAPSLRKVHMVDFLQGANKSFNDMEPEGLPAP